MNSQDLLARMRLAKIQTNPDAWIHLLVRSTRAAHLLTDAHFKFHAGLERNNFVCLLESLGYTPEPIRYWGHFNPFEVTCAKCGTKHTPLDRTQFVLPTCPAEGCSLTLYDRDIYYKKWGLVKASQLNLFWQGLTHRNFDKAIEIWRDNMKK